MRYVKFAVFLLAATLLAGNALAQSDVVVQAYRTVNVRSGPGTQYDIIGRLTSGNELQATGRSDEESNWLRIDLDGREGWVAYFTVTVLGDADDLAVVTPRNAQLAPPFVATPTPRVAISDTFVTAYRTVNVRSGPGIDYVNIGDLLAGSSADVTGRSEDNRWLRIEFGSRSGWVAFFVVNLTGSLDEIAIVTPSPNAETVEPPDSIEVVTRYNVNLHASPTLESAIIATVPFNTVLQAEARSSAGSDWLLVRYNGRAGWLLRALVNARAEPAILPVGSS